MTFVQILGHLGADPEPARFTPGGQKVTTLRVAVNTRSGGKEETMWWQVTLWGEAFDKKLPYFKKGSSIIVRGTMQPVEMYADKPRLRMTAEAIDFSPFGNKSGEGKSERTGSEQPYAPAQSNQQENSSQGSFSGYAASGSAQNNMDEEIPF